jgi:pimeloyl-ACP methyl ester carboxylesterase
MTRSTELELDFGWNGLSLTGSVHLPPGPGPHPALLMMQGSGPTDRDSQGYFPPIRRGFLDRGMAVFSFDKPGVGESDGDWREYALEGRTSQALAAVGALSAHPDIDDERLGVWGHSQGGWLTQILASRRSDLSFAICSSGPAIGIAEQDLYGCEHTMRADGHSEEEIQRALGFLAALHREASRGTDYGTVDGAILSPAREQPWYGYLTIDDPADWRFMCLVMAEGYEPVTTISQIRCPYLAVYGGLDLLVPAWESAWASGDALHRAGNPDGTVVVFPGGDHRLLDADTGEFVPGYLDLIADWAARKVAGR